MVEFPLMSDNVSKESIQTLVKFLSQDPLPQFTNGPMVRKFEKEWGEWLGCPLNTMVGSGSAANQISLMILRHLYPQGGKVLVPVIGWVSDVSSILQAGFEPVFVDVNLHNLAVNVEDLARKVDKDCRALILVHALGLNGLSDDLLNLCKEHNLLLIDDLAESHGVTFKGQKIGNFGDINNFSFFYAHHLVSLAEGGMIGTKNKDYHNLIRAYRSHGMNREAPDEQFKNKVIADNPTLNPDFIFLGAAMNGRSQEVNAVVASEGLLRLDSDNAQRIANMERFMSKLDGNKYFLDFDLTGQCSYAFILILKNASFSNRNIVERELKAHGIEARRGTSGGGNLTRQPLLKLWGYNFDPKDYPIGEYLSDFGWYLGNYPKLSFEKVDKLVGILNNIRLE